MLKIEIDLDKLSLREKDYLSKKKGKLQDEFYNKFGENKPLKFFNSVSLNKIHQFNKLYNEIG